MSYSIYCTEVEDKSDRGVEAVERAMVAIRRRQTRRALARRDQAAGEARPLAAGAGFDVLDAVEAAEQTGALASISDLAAALNVDQPRASKLVAAAEAAGLVRRETDPADRRRARLAPTPSGRALLERVHRQRRAAFAAAMAGWPEADRAAFARLLTAFVEALDDPARPTGPHGPAPPTRSVEPS